MIALILALLASFPPPLDRQREITRDLANLPLARVRIVHELGGVRVLPAAAGRSPRAVLETIAAGEAKAGEQAFLDAVTLEATAGDGGSTTIRSRFPPAESKPQGLSFAAQLTLYLPPAANVRIENRYGPVVVSGREADVAIRNRLGTITVADVEGGVTIDGSFGDIAVRDTTGPVTITAKTSAVRLVRVRGTMRVTTTFREVHVQDGAGTATLENRGAPTIVEGLEGSAELLAPYCEVTARRVTGDLTIEGSQQPVLAEDIGGDLVVHHHLGSITARGIGGDARIAADLTPIVLRDVRGRAEVASPSSPILLARVGGGATIEGSFAPIVLEDVGGDVRAIGRDGLLRASWTRLPMREGTTPAISLESGSSPIEIEIPAGASVEVRAQASRGTITSDIAGLKSVSAGDVCSGTLRLGKAGATIDVTCEGGDVRLRKAAAAARESGAGGGKAKSRLREKESGGGHEATGSRGT